MALLALVIFLGLTLSGEPQSHSEAAVQTQPRRATLRVVEISPFTVAGRSFKPGETVRVSTNRLRRKVIASPRGGFTVTFPNANLCNGLQVTAVGSSGSRASISLAALAKIHCVAP